jgi:hypothetical protein
VMRPSTFTHASLTRCINPIMLFKVKSQKPNHGIHGKGKTRKANIYSGFDSSLHANCLHQDIQRSNMTHKHIWG